MADTYADCAQTLAPSDLFGNSVFLVFPAAWDQLLQSTNSKIFELIVLE